MSNIDKMPMWWWVHAALAAVLSYVFGSIVGPIESAFLPIQGPGSQYILFFFASFVLGVFLHLCIEPTGK